MSRHARPSGAASRASQSSSPSPVALAVRAADHIHQFPDLLPLVGLVAAGDGVLDAMGHMVAQHLLLDAAERGAHRGDLRDDVDAVAVLVDHFRQAPNLTLDPAESLLNGCLDVFSHLSYIPLQGIGFKGAGASKCQLLSKRLRTRRRAAAADMTMRATAITIMAPQVRRRSATPSAA